MTELLYFTDPHVSESHGLGGANFVDDSNPDFDRPITRSLLQAHYAFRALEDLARRRDPDVIVCGGDLYDRPNPSPNEESVAVRGIMRLAEYAPVHIVLGNHTQSHSGDSTALASIEAAGNPRVTVHSKPGTFTTGLDDLFFVLPYPPISGTPNKDDWSPEMSNGRISDGLNQILEAFAAEAREFDDVATCLLPHVTFRGADYESGRTVPTTDVAVSTQHLGHFDTTVAGHIHLRQKIGGLGPRHQYVGPPYRWSFNDEGNPVGAVSVELSSSGVSWDWHHFDEQSLKFETVGPGGLDEYDPDQDPRPTILRIKGEVEDLDRLHEVESQIGELQKWAHLSIRNDVTLERSEAALDDSIDASHTLRDIYDAFCESRPGEIPEDRRDDTFELVDEIATEATE